MLHEFSFLAAAAPAVLVAAPISIFLTRKPKTAHQLREKIDAQLHDRICALLTRPVVTDLDAYTVISECGGIRHLVSQAALLASIANEEAKDGRQAETLTASAELISKLVGNVIARTLDPFRHGAAIAQVFGVMAGIWSDIEVDG